MTAIKFSETIDFSPGQVVYEEFHLTDSKEWAEQLDDLNEDLLQVEFPGNVILDIGWYPMGDPKGQFKVKVIRDFDWEQPIFYAKVSTLGVLRSVVEAAKRTAVEAALVAD